MVCSSSKSSSKSSPSSSSSSSRRRSKITLSSFFSFLGSFVRICAEQSESGKNEERDFFIFLFSAARVYELSFFFFYYEYYYQYYYYYYY